MEVSSGLARLTELFPLKLRQDALDPALRNLHRSILLRFAAAGRPLSRSQISALTGEEMVDVMLQRLAADDLVVLSDDKQEVTGAYPFTLQPRAHRVHVFTGNAFEVYAMCALDALAIAPMCRVSTTIYSRCHVTGSTVAIKMTADEINSASPAEVHVGIRWQSTAGCAAKNLCMEMVYLRDKPTARAWQQQAPANISIFSLDAAARFAAEFFTPLLDSE